ncbi:MAG: TonB-dependent receptor [Gammaproteobacteria bacterium]|nr:TonB-dependent receptor [Gammaproteobacteria bacterium]
MSNLKEKSLALIAFLLAFSMASVPAFAQEDAVEDAEVQVEDDVDDDTEEVVVTGSRLRKTSFTSISPLQVLDTEATREVGLIDASDILQESTSATGQQIDLTFQGFVLDNGPGSSTASLRGLGAARTLILINGRRVAPSGVEGAPSAPDLNLIPGGLVQRYEFLLDGASSVYGSDAVAGVVNVIMKKDFDGLELELIGNIPEQSNGEDYTISATYGKNYDRGFFGIGAEYYKSTEVTLADREWTDECNKHYEIDQAGNIRTVGFDDQVFNGQGPSPCKRQGLAGRFQVGAGLPFGGFGSIYYTPGQGNALADWSESGIFGVNIDADGDGVTDVDFQNHIINGREQFASLYPEVERTSVMGYGEYTLEGDMNLTPFVEVMYNERETFADSGAFQLFPWIDANNPYNPCNPNGFGVDCGLAYDAFFQNPNVISDFAAVYGVPPAAFGLGFYGASGPLEARPIASVRGDRTQVTSVLEQTRVVAGVRGDLPQLPIGGNNDWKFEVAVTHTEADGTASRPGIRQDRIDLTSQTSVINPDGSVTCGNGSDGCVPVNFFAPSLYEGVVGDFATQAERDFLFDTRDFRTKYEQTIGSIFLDGSLFDLPGGTAQGGIGFAYRDDKIASIPDDVARDGLFFGFFSDSGAVGDKYTKETYAEIDLPLLANKQLAKELNLNLSAAYTQDEVHDSDTTYSAKLGYRPVDSLLLRGTVGTSYRAPNLRETFLAGQTGFNTISDPCVIPDDAYDTLTETYLPANDQRRPEVLANCLANGVDPTALYLGGFSSYSVEISRGGAAGLKSETSDSFSVGFAFDQPWFDAFDMSLGMTYYGIDIEDTIVEPSGQGIVNSCYFDREGDSPDCTRIARAPDADGDLVIDLLNGAFLNRDLESTEGLDVNISFDKPLTLFERAFDFGADLNLNRTINNKLVESEIDGNGDRIEEVTEFDGRFGFPNWQGNLSLRAEFNEYRLTWGTRYIGEVEQFGDEYSDINGLSSTCFGPSQDDLLCKDVNFAGSYLTHSLSLFYRGDQYTIGGGVSNIFGKAPPLVDSAQVLATNNTPIGYGYDLNGRTFFINLGGKFDF